MRSRKYVYFSHVSLCACVNGREGDELDKEDAFMGTVIKPRCYQPATKVKLGSLRTAEGFPL